MIQNIFNPNVISHGTYTELNNRIAYKLEYYGYNSINDWTDINSYIFII